MRLYSLVLSASFLVVACQPSKHSSSTESSEDVAVVGTSMEQLGSDSLSLLDSASATKAILDCPGVSGQEISFVSGQADIIRKNKSLSLCTLVLKEFTLGGKTYEYKSVYRNLPPVGLFESSDGDSRLVRHMTLFTIFNRPSSCDAQGQKCWDYEVKFAYSDINKGADVIVKNELIVNQLEIKMPEESAATCTVKGEWKEAATIGQEPNLLISLSACSNTIGTLGIEYGLSIFSDSSTIEIADAHKLVTDAQKKGLTSSSADISLSLSQVQDLLIAKGKPASIFHALQADFTLAVRNSLGISVSIYELK